MRCRVHPTSLFESKRKLNVSMICTLALLGADREGLVDVLPEILQQGARVGEPEVRPGVQSKRSIHPSSA